MHMTSFFRIAVSATILALVTGCATQHHRAPVEDRGARAGAASGSGSSASSGSGQTTQPKGPPPGAENAGKPGYYTVAKGDTLIRIGLESGQNYRDIATWNNLENPNVIEVGQVLRVVPPGVDPSASGASLPAAKPVTIPKVEAKGLDSKTASSPASAASAAASKPVATASAAAASTPATPPDAKDASDEPAWVWPSAGPVIGGFEEGKRKGLAIGGKEGDPVVAAGDGRVVYAGSGLRGYGNLVIVKHSGDYLTAYAHNKTLLVKEDQVVRKGQKIAEMGQTDTDKVQLHFEIRKQGKPIDPAKQLPGR